MTLANPRRRSGASGRPKGRTLRTGAAWSRSSLAATSPRRPATSATALPAGASPRPRWVLVTPGARATQSQAAVRATRTRGTGRPWRRTWRGDFTPPRVLRPKGGPAKSRSAVGPASCRPGAERCWPRQRFPRSGTIHAADGHSHDEVPGADADCSGRGQRPSGDLRFASIHACTSASSHSRTRACRTFGSGKLGRRESWSARVRDTPSMSATSLIPTSAMAPKHRTSSKDSISKDSPLSVPGPGGLRDSYG